MVICLERGANDLHMVQLMPLPPYRLMLTQIVLEKRPLKQCLSVYNLLGVGQTEGFSASASPDAAQSLPFILSKTLPRIAVDSPLDL